MYHGTIFGSELAVPLILLVCYAFMLMDASKFRRKSIFCLFLALSTTLVFVVNTGDNLVPLRNGRVVSLASPSFGLPARGFWVESKLNYSHEFNVAGQSQPVGLSFSCTAFDSSGARNYRLERAQRYLDLVKRPHGTLSAYLTAELERRNIGAQISDGAAENDSTRLNAIAQLIKEIGQPIDIKHVTNVAIKRPGGGS